ncbi:MAG: hypothetical protein WCO66_02330 [Candidatus Absconditabacteria bacterium]
MEAKNTSEAKELCKEWKSLTGKTFSHVNEKLGLKGWLIVGFGIVIVALLAHMGHQRGDRFERNFGDRQSMMQERGGMMGIFRDEAERGEGKGFGPMQGIQGCNQQATVEIDPANPDVQMIKMQGNCPFADQKDGQGRGGKYQDGTGEQGFFDRMETRMKAFFGDDKKGATATGAIATGDTK